MASTTSGSSLSASGGFGSMLAGLGGYWLLRYAGVSFETMLAALLAIVIAMVIGVPLGLFVGYLMSRDGDVDTTACRLIAWGNVAGWVVPVVGMCLSSITWQLSRRSYASPGLYGFLSTIGGMLAIASAGIGAGLESKAQATEPMFSSSPSEQTSVSSDRSRAR